MIAPIVEEEEWLETLSDVPRWLPPWRRTLVVAPHPDDETLGAGGLIASQIGKGVPAGVICVTDGEAAYPYAHGLAAIRELEQTRALEALGVPGSDIVRLRLPDSEVTGQEAHLEHLLASLVKPGDLVLAPWTRDWHPDHEACGRASSRVCKAMGVELVFYVFWTWHQATPASLLGQDLRRFDLEPSLQSLKQRALNCHRSQLERETEDPILPEYLLKPARRSFETFIVND